MPSLSLRSLYSRMKRMKKSKHRTLKASTDTRPQTTSSQCPIARLDEIIIHYILTIIGDMEDERISPTVPCALDTLRYLSQVNSWFRKIILFSPSVWGSVANLNRCGNSKWRLEVFRRTRTASLDIYGEALPLFCADFDDPFDNDSILSPLSEGWSRIRSLHLSLVCCPCILSRFVTDHRILAPFRNPPPAMKSLVLSFHRSKAEAVYWKYRESLPKALSTTYPNDSLTMAAQGLDKTSGLPYLISVMELGGPSHLAVLAAPNFRLDINSISTFQTNLRELTLTTPALACHVLKFLQFTPLLQSLHIYCLAQSDSNEDSAEQRPRKLKIGLPHLTSIYFPQITNIPEYTTILLNITPADSHNLIFSACEITSVAVTPEAEDISDLSCAITTYTKQSRQWLAGAAEMTLCMLPFELDIQVSGNGRAFVLEIGSLDRESVIFLSQAFDIPDFATLEQVKYYVDDDLAAVDVMREQIPRAIRAISPSVKVVASSPRSLISLLSSLPDEFYEDGPAFKNMWQIDLHDAEDATVQDLTTVRELLEKRVSRGLPICVIQVVIKGGQNNVDHLLLTILKAIRGLNVISVYENRRSAAR